MSGGNRFGSQEGYVSSGDERSKDEMEDCILPLKDKRMMHKPKQFEDLLKQSFKKNNSRSFQMKMAKKTRAKQKDLEKLYKVLDKSTIDKVSDGTIFDGSASMLKGAP